MQDLDFCECEIFDILSNKLSGGVVALEDGNGVVVPYNRLAVVLVEQHQEC